MKNKLTELELRTTLACLLKCRRLKGHKEAARKRAVTKITKQVRDLRFSRRKQKEPMLKQITKVHQALGKLTILRLKERGYE